MSSSTALSSGRGLISIGGVLDQLKADYPDITISKIRFLEEQGLVKPERTPAGYRKYSTSDVGRLKFILSQQRDHFLPLRVIRELLDAMDRGVHPANAAGGPRPAHPTIVDNAPTPAHFHSAPATMRLTEQELLNTAGLRVEQLRELEQYGLITRRAGGHYDDDALAVASVVGEMARFGIEGRHLRGFKSAADREVGLFEQIVGPMVKQRGGDGRAKAEETVRELAALSVRLHSALVQIGLRDVVS